MKKKFSKILGLGLALALVLSLVVMAVPVSADHTSDAVIDFADGASEVAGEDSILDVTVTNAITSDGDINKVKIDFSVGDFTVTGPGADPTGWTGSLEGDVVTYTPTNGDIAPDESVTFSPAVTNPVAGAAAVPAVLTTDTGSKAAVDAAAGTGWIGYVADSAGAAGNTITVDYVNPGFVDQDLSVSVAGNDITVSLATDGEMSVTSTAAEVATAINGHGDAGALVDATADSENLDYIVQVLTVNTFADGTDPQVDVDCTEAPATLEVFPAFEVVATPTDPTSAADTSYDVGFTTVTEIVATTGTIVITFAEGYDISAISEVVDEDVVMLIDDPIPDTAYTPSAIAVDAVAGTVTITATDGTGIAADVAVDIAIGNDHIGNPPASGDYDIIVAGADPDADADTVTIVPDAFEVVAGALDTVTAGTPFVVTLQALNADTDPDTGYIDAHYIDFVWVGAPTDATIPVYELITFAAGEGTSPANFILTTTGESITITASEGTLAGTSAADITINLGALGSFTITDTATTEAGAVFGTAVTVEALDVCGNLKTDYTGTVTWSSSDTAAGVTLPADYPFTGVGEDDGSHDFAAGDFILVTVGEEDQTITVADGEIEVSDTVAVTATDADSLTAEASVLFIVANGTDTSIITASTQDEYGNVVLAGETIDFETNLGSLTGKAQVEGVATIDLKSSELGTATIKVTSTTLDTPITVTVDMVETAVVDDIVVTAVKDPEANTYDVTATYVDAEGETVTAAAGSDYAVTFSTSPTVGVTLDPEDGVVSPTAGVAALTQFTTTLGPGETITVTATGVGKSGTVEITVGVYISPITLEAGWNLISLPLIPDDSDIDTVLAGITDGTVEQVRTYDQGTWHNWASTPPEPSNLITDMEDGQGFWVASAEGGTLDVSGYELCGPFPALPPTYTVYSGWNLIGFKFTTTGTIAAYLGDVGGDNLQAIYGYDAATGLYVIPGTNLVPGCGYWIALTLGGTIYPVHS